jgi:gluconokinase
MLVLALEASTTSVKAMLYDSAEGIKDVAVIPFDEKIGMGAEQDTHAVYESLLQVGRKVAQGKEIAAIGLGGIWHGLVVCDSKMQPVTPTYTWEYMDSANYIAGLRQDAAFTQRAYQATGCMVHAIYPAYRLAYLKACGMDLKNKYIAGQGSYNFFRMTGDRLTSKSIKSGSGFLNIHRLDYEQEILDLSGIKKEQLGSLCTHRDTRPLLKEAAEKLGIAAGIPVVPPVADGALNQIGSGALRTGIMTLSVGTSAALRLPSDVPVIPEVPSTWCYYAPGKYLSGAAISGATNCVDWYMQNILGGRVRYKELEAMVTDKKQAPIFMPFLFGERCPGWRDYLKGGFVDLTGSTGIGDQYFAVLEGVVFNLYQCYLRLTNIMGEPDRIFVSGGICNSELWLSILTDTLQKEITLLSNEQASLLGGAVLALNAIGSIQNIEDFELETQRTIQPEKENAKLHQIRFNRYLEYYDTIK